MIPSETTEERSCAVALCFYMFFFLTLFTVYVLSPKYQYMHSLVAKTSLII